MGKRRLFFIILLFLGFYLIVSLSRDIFVLVKKGEEVQKQNLELKNLEKKGRKLEVQLEYFSSEEFIERQARDKLGLAKPGEQVLVLPENLGEGLEDRDRDREEEELPNWKKWVELFF